MLRRVAIIGAHDGDTIRDSSGQKYRLYGIDAPESKQEFGKQSADALRMFLTQHNNVVYVQDHGKEKYGRTLATFYTSANPDQDLQNLNYMLVANGYAWVYRFQNEERRRGRPIRPELDEYERAESDAQAARRGLWAYPNPERPQDYRRRTKRMKKPKVVL